MDLCPGSSCPAPRPWPRLRPCHARLICVGFHRTPASQHSHHQNPASPMYGILGKTAPSSMEAPPCLWLTVCVPWPRSDHAELAHLQGTMQVPGPMTLCALQRSLNYCCVSASVLDVGVPYGLCLQRTHSSFAGTWTVATLVQGRGWVDGGRHGGSSGWVE